MIKFLAISREERKERIGIRDSRMQEGDKNLSSALLACTVAEPGHKYLLCLSVPSVTMKPDRSLTLSESLARLKAKGFAQELRIEDGQVALENGKRVEATSCVIVDKQRMEGQSDPDDMAIVYAIVTGEGERGTLVDAFGLYGDPSVSAAVQQMHDETLSSQQQSER